MNELNGFVLLILLCNLYSKKNMALEFILKGGACDEIKIAVIIHEFCVTKQQIPTVFYLNAVKR